jgi:hypothetical protein
LKQFGTSTDLWLEPNSRVGIIREVDCVYSRDTEIEFFRTDENEETLVLLTELAGMHTFLSPATLAKPFISVLRQSLKAEIQLTIVSSHSIYFKYDGPICFWSNSAH